MFKHVLDQFFHRVTDAVRSSMDLPVFDPSDAVYSADRSVTYMLRRPISSDDPLATTSSNTAAAPVRTSLEEILCKGQGARPMGGTEQPTVSRRDFMDILG